MSNDAVADDLGGALTTLTVNETSQPSPNLDAALNDADSPTRINDDFSLRRPQEVRENLTATLGVPLKRLAFRSQPVASQTVIFEITERSGTFPDSYDWGRCFLDGNLKIVVGTDCPLYKSWRAGLDRHTDELGMNAQMPTMLDTIAVLPESSWSKAVSNFYDFIMMLLTYFKAHRDTIWRRELGEDLLANRLALCNAYALIQRVTFYQARIHSQSLEVYTAEFGQMRKEIGIPVDFDMAKELHDIKISCYQRRHEIQESFSEALQLEWVGPLIPVTKVSTMIKNPDGAECIICGSDLGWHGILTIPCRHTYCTDCLEHWIHAAQKTSHTCPYCRTELFSKPDYRPKYIDGERNYQVELERHDSMMTWYSWIEISAAWYNAELEMQRLYEVELENSVVPAN